MQKKIIALSIAAALTSPALAMAEANVYGLVDLSIDMANNGLATNSSSTNQLTSNVSRIGVKGSEDLGSGNTFVWQMEGTVGMDTGTSALFDRDTFVGFANANAGTAVLGRHDTPYKMATRKLDVFADSAADNRKLMGLGFQDARLNNVIAYISPNLSGLTIAAATTFGAETAGYTAGVADKKGSALSLAGMYNQGPIYATVAYQTIKAGTTGSGDMGAGELGTLASANNAVIGAINALIAPSTFGLVADDKITSFKLGGSYSMDQFSVNAIYESNKIAFAVGGGSVKQTDLYLSGKFNITSADAVKLAYTSKGATTPDTGTALKDKATEIAIGFDHDLSKTTQVYALYAKQTWEDTLADPSVLSVGIKHSF